MAKIETKPEDETKPCPICRGSLETLYKGIPDLYDQVGGRYSIAVCKHCGIGVTTPQYAGDTRDLYPNEYLGVSTVGSSSTKLLSRFERWYRKDQARFDFDLVTTAMSKPISSLTSYCDVGCGTGDRVAYVFNQGCENSIGIDAFDFFNSMPNKSVHFVQTEIQDFNPSSKFSLVSLFHVLEHVPNPVSTIKHVVENIVSPNGYLVIQVPNFGSIERSIYGSQWSALDIPRHLWHFNSSILSRLIEDAGCAIIGVYGRNALLHPVTAISSALHDTHPQRNWILGKKSPSSYWLIMKIVWMIGTVLSIPWSLALSVANDASMLTIVAQKQQS